MGSFKQYSSRSVEVLCNFDRKYYIAFDNVLRAAYLRKVEIKLSQLISVHSKSKVITHFEVAGLGMHVIDNSCSFNLSKIVFTDIDSFKKKNNGFASGQRFPRIEMDGKPCFSYIHWKESIKEMFDYEVDTYVNNEYFKVFRWKWNGIESEKVDVPVTTVTLTPDGFSSDAIIPENSYRTKEECDAANQISVIEFED